jgi:exodeoxyribonuclease V beta subunit
LSANFPRPAILDKVPRGRNAVIEASAGTGKTHTIEHMVVELILRGRVPLSEILVLTFTERAAVELRQRIRSKIESILLVADEGAKRGARQPGDGWLIDEIARQNLSRALFSFDSASIGTFHGFFGRVLAEHAFTGGRLFKGTLEDGRGLFGRAFKSALRRSLARRPGPAADLLALWLEQHRGGIEKLEALLWSCHSSRRIILPPFSIEALQREIESSPLFEIDLLTEADPFKTALKGAKVHANTIKAMMTRMTVIAEMVRSSGRSWRMALDDRFQAAVSDIAKDLKRFDLADGRVKPIAEAIVRLDRALVCLEAAIVQTSLPIVRAILERHKVATGEFDHDDQIKGVAVALDGMHGADLVRAMRGRYRFALIDEFQDTDELQWSFFERVFVESEGRNLVYLIGDPKQAIYGFRGADVYTYLRARDRVEQAGSPLVPLMENFRSTRALIKAYNHILDPLADPPFFDGEVRYDRPVMAGRELVVEQADGTPATPVHLLKIEPKEGDSLSTGELKRGLARQIAREARDLLSEKTGLWFGPAGETKRIEPGEVFVLTATNKEAIQVSQALREADVPFAFYKQDGLFQTDEARAIHDLLAAIADPADVDKRGRAWITPFFAVPLAALPDLDDLPHSDPLIMRLRDWNDLASKRRFEALFTRVLDESGIIRRELFLKDDERALTNYLHIFEILLQDARTVGRDLADLVAILTAYIQQTRKPPGEDGNIQRLESDCAAVQIMTIHKSKGLEAAVVFLYGGFGRFWGGGTHEYHENGQRVMYIGDNDEAKKKAREDRSREEQRLYYVALTRAKARLYLPWVPDKLGDKKWDGGYRRLNERLTAIASTLDGTADHELFRVVTFRDRPLEMGRSDPGRTDGDLETWQAKDILRKKPPDLPNFYQLRQNHAGYVVSSYSGMKRVESAELDPLERDEFRREPGQKTVATVLADDELPGGTATGTMLHEVLEKVPFDSLNAQPMPNLDDWLGLKPVQEVFDVAMARNGITATDRQRRRAGEMIYRALTITIPLGPDRSIPGLHNCPHVLPEMEFLFPFPEDFHGRLSDPHPRPGKLVIERGYIKGFVDLVVEHDDRVYFADWKSDVLPSYEPDAIAAHIGAHYQTQVKLYSLALVKALMLKSEAEYSQSFGGLFYVFLRALSQDDGDSRGVYFERPSWADILQYEAELTRFELRPGKGRA